MEPDQLFSQLLPGVKGIHYTRLLDLCVSEVGLGVGCEVKVHFELLFVDFELLSPLV